MPWELIEQLGAEDGSIGENGRREIPYLVRGDGTSDSPGLAMAEAYADAPADLDGFAKVGATVESLGGYVYQVVVQYAAPALAAFTRPAADAPNRVVFSTRGGTVNVKKSLATVASVGRPPDDPPPSFGQLINVTDDGVEGVDIIAPVHTKTVTRYLADATVNTAFENTIADLTGTVNNATFLGRAAGEVLFVGADSNPRGDGVTEVTYEFLIRKNQTGIAVDDLDTFNQKGHEYAWFRVRQANTASGVILRPAYGYVERVYPEADFTPLGIS